MLLWWLLAIYLPWELFLSIFWFSASAIQTRFREVRFVCLYTASFSRKAKLDEIGHWPCQGHTLSQIKAGPPPPPLEAILVIFGRRALIFFFVWKLLEKYEKWHHFCAHAQWWSPWRRKKCRKRAPRSVEFNFFIICDRHKPFSQNERRRTDLQNVASDFLIFA